MFINSQPINKVRVGLFILSLLLSTSSCYYFFYLGITNLYGDGVAHLNIARKVVDLNNSSLWSHYLQLGSPWLPIPHLLVLPFVYQDYLWQTGLAGSLISMLSYIICAQFVFEIGHIFGDLCLKTEKSLLAGLLAYFIFSINPSILYLQSTPMTELLFLATFVGGVYFLIKYASDNLNRYIILSAVMFFLAMLTRYEAWAILPAGVVTILITTRGNLINKLRHTALWCLIVGLAPIYWFWHNWAIYGNALEFYSGFYSAKGIYLRQQERLGWTAFVVGRPHLAFLLGLATTMACSGWILLLAVAGFIKTLFILYKEHNREFFIKLFPTFLLVIPFLFTVYSLFTGNIQIYPLSAISLLNVRYGLNSLLALAVFPIVFLSVKRKSSILLIFFLIILNYFWLVSDGVKQLAVVQEPYRNNSNSREARARTKLVNYLLKHPQKRQIMIYGGDLGPIIPACRMHFKDLIFEGINEWHSEKIPKQANTIIVKEGDQLWQKLEKDASFSKEFQLVYQIGPNPRMMVWQRIEITN